MGSSRVGADPIWFMRRTSIFQRNMENCLDGLRDNISVPYQEMQVIQEGSQLPTKDCLCQWIPGVLMDPGCIITQRG